VAPVIRKPAASLQRAAVKIWFAADRGDVQDAEAVDIAQQILAHISNTERASLTSQGDRFHAVPDLTRFKTDGRAYLLYAAEQITLRELIEIAVSETPAEDPQEQQQVVEQPAAATTHTEQDNSKELYRDDGVIPTPPTEATPPGLNSTAPAIKQVQQTLDSVTTTRKRGPNRSWEDKRAERSWESSFDSELSSVPEESPENVAESHPPLPISAPQIRTTPPQNPLPGLLSTPTGTVPSPLQVLFLHHSPFHLSPKRTSEASISHTPSAPIPPYLISPCSNISLLDINDPIVNPAPDLARRPATPVNRSISLPDRSESSPSPAVEHQERQASPTSSVSQQKSARSRPQSPSFWTGYIPEACSPEPFHYTQPPLTPTEDRRWNLVIDTFTRIESRMEDITKTLLDRQDELDKKLSTLLDLFQKQAASADDDKAKAEARARLEAEQKQKMIDLENEYKAKFADAGIAGDFTSLITVNNGTAARSYDKVENPKADQIGILDPLPAHKEWTGQAVNASGHWISFSKWLTQLEAVLAQKQSVV
jgi:hypothetical protein